MIIGDEMISDGEVYVCGTRLKYFRSSACENIGYCPQLNAYFEEFTVTQNLELFSRLRGIDPSDIPDLIEHLATELNFLEYIDQKVDELSGGNRRKLSTAIALIGNPPVICLGKYKFFFYFLKDFRLVIISFVASTESFRRANHGNGSRFQTKIMDNVIENS